MSIYIVGTDIDGVWTDGGMYYDNSGNELKKFNTYDAAGVKILSLLEKDFFVATGENTQIVTNRMKKLNIKECYQGVTDKYELISKILKNKKMEWTNLAYVGDDINDYKVLKNAGISACPKTAPEYIKEVVDFIIPVKGGDGVFRYFVENILLPEISNKSVIDIFGLDK